MTPYEGNVLEIHRLNKRKIIFLPRAYAAKSREVLCPNKLASK